MADALVSVVLDQLAWLLHERAKLQANLFTGTAAKVDNLRQNLQAIQAVLRDAERRKMKEDSVSRWLDELTDVSYDMSTVLDRYITASRRRPVSHSAFNSSKTFFQQLSRRREFAVRIESLNEKLSEIGARKDSFSFSLTSCVEVGGSRPDTTSIIDVPKVYGQDELKNTLISRLLYGSGRLEIITVIGMGGIGKTTLAKQAYNDEKVRAHFGEQRMWVCVSHPFDEVSIATSIIEQAEDGGGRVGSAGGGMEMLMLFFRRSIQDKRFLLVLDDVWTDDYVEWGPLEQKLSECAAGSKIVVTTRKEEVAKMVGRGPTSLSICIEKLNEEDLWALFSEIALSGRGWAEQEELRRIGEEIARKCKGLPLAAKALASLLRVKRTREEWMSVLRSEMWEIEKVKENLFSPFLVGYYDLSPLERRCFSYCAVVPKDDVIERDDLVQQWMAHGYLNLNKNEEEEAVGRKCFESLAARSFFQDFSYGSDGTSVSSCKMHDIVHDFAQSLTLNEFSTIVVDGSKTRSVAVGARHVLMILPSDTHIPLSILKSKSLHTLVVLRSTISPILADHFLHLSCLRSLNLSNCSIKELPENIGKLIHLRYLNLSNNQKLEELPRAICRLCNLQTLRLINCGLIKLPENVHRLISLRHLYVSSLSLRSLPNGICKLENLQTLNLNSCGLTEIPENVGELTQLKRLDLSDNIELMDLPSSVGDLCNLETLQLYNCRLDNLPEEVAKLMNLRHLYVFSISLESLPKGIGGLTNLHTFKDMFISPNNEMLQLKDLRNLDYLRHICLNGLGTEEHVDEAVEAELTRKSYLHDLTLIFSDGGDTEIHKTVLEALQPHPNLKQLVLYNYSSHVISPSWMVSLINLKKLVFDLCPNCEIVPPLGTLPSLESLEISLLESFTTLGPEFLGINDRHSSEGTSISGENRIRASFPKLQRFILKRMMSLHEWNGIHLWNVDSPTRIMPCLEYLMLNNCWSLQALPDFLQTAPLKHLIIEHSPILEEHYQKDTGLYWAKIRHIPCIQFTNDIVGV